MPIVISRRNDEAIPAFAQVQADLLWERLVKNYLQIHPEVLANSEENAG